MTSTPCSSSNNLRPLLAFVHIPKTAGQAFVRALYTAFPGKVLNITGAETPGAVANLHLFERRLRENPDAVVLTSHGLRLAFPETLADRKPLYVTLLRDPYRQVKSYIRYVKWNYTAFPERVRRFLPQGADRMSQVDIARRMMDTCPEGYMATFHFLPCPFLAMSAEAGPVIERLERFAAVGVVEEINASLELMRRRLLPQGIELPAGPLPRVNESPESGPDDAELDAYQPLRDFLHDYAAADFEVHAWAQRRLGKTR
ncbi:MAG: hypothetical protein ACREIT_01365 [Tepidisphaeraceae bacterium]